LLRSELTGGRRMPVRSVGKAGDHTVDPEPVKPAEHGSALDEVHHHEGRTQPVTRSAGEVDRRGREPWAAPARHQLVRMVLRTESTQRSIQVPVYGSQPVPTCPCLLRNFREPMPEAARQIQLSASAR